MIKRRRGMSWLDFMDTQERDEYDEKALEKYREWNTMACNDVVREVFIGKRYDPDMLNEFCFYPMEMWDRLIQWSKQYDSPEQ